MKLSIIIPVYRVEATLERCVQSIVGQDWNNMELILIDDGSPDRCPQLCDEWARRDRRISVIHKQNGGLSDARNTGIDAARGDYLTFVDSDDYLAPDTLPRLMAILDAHPDYDLLEYGMERNASPWLQLADHAYTDMGHYWLAAHAYDHTYACNKIYRRTLFDGVRFPVGRVFEDAYTLPRLLAHARTVATTSAGAYHYTPNPAGITATASGQQLYQLLTAHLQSGMPMDDRYYMHLANIQADVCELTGLPPQLPRRHISHLGSLGTPKLKLKAITLNIIGINGLCKSIKMLHHLARRLRW